MIFISDVALLGASGLVFMMIILTSSVNLKDGGIPLSMILIILIYLGSEIWDAFTAHDNVSHLTHILGGVCGPAHPYGAGASSLMSLGKVNPKIIRKYHYRSDFLGIRTERTDDWCFEAADGLIKEEKVGGTDCWQMVGISYWNHDDGQKLSQDIADVYAAPGGRERYWEQVPLVYRKKHYKVELRECTSEDVIEIDTFRELKQIDKTYDV